MLITAVIDDESVDDVADMAEHVLHVAENVEDGALGIERVGTAEAFLAGGVGHDGGRDVGDGGI